MGICPFALWLKIAHFLKRELLSLLFKTDRCEWFARDSCELLVIRANRLQKTSKLIEKCVFLICFWHFSPFVCPRANRFRCSIQKSNRERFDQAAHDKRATGEPLFHKRITLSLKKNERFARKTDDRIPNAVNSSHEFNASSIKLFYLCFSICSAFFILS